MRLLVLFSVVVVAAVGFASCADEPPPIKACVGETRAPAGREPAVPSEPLLGIVQRPNESGFLAWRDPLSLEPVSRDVEVPEYHDAWSLSPDGSRLALGVSSGRSLISPARPPTGRIGILIVDLTTLRIVREVETGIAAEALGWLGPRLLVAGLQRGGTVLVDPLTGKIVRRWPELSDPDESAPTRSGLAMLFPGLAPARAPRLAVADAGGRLRSVVLERARAGVESPGGAGLAVDPSRARAYVFAADAPVAEVDMRTMRVAYHRLEALSLGAGEFVGSEAQEKDEPQAKDRAALWLGDGRVLVFGRDFVPAGAEDFAAIAAGATLVDTATWSACMLDAEAGGAAFVSDRLLVYGAGDPPGVGLRAYTIAGRQAYHLLNQERVLNVEGAGDLAYVHTPSTLRVIDVRSGEVVSPILPPHDFVEVIEEP